MPGDRFYRKTIEQSLHKEILEDAPSPLVREALALSFLGGKRLRPAITLDIANSLKGKFTGPRQPTAAVSLISELIHTASLIIDDLPCMDNDTERRGHPTIHHKYGETRAQVVSMWLFSKVYQMIHREFQALREAGLEAADERRIVMFRCLTDNLGIFGAPMGQFLDTCGHEQTRPTDRPTEETWLRDLIHKKTSTLFEIAFILGYLVGGGPLTQLDQVRDCAHHFGIAFQISDDVLDTDKDAGRPFCPNVVNHLGRKRALHIFHDSVQHCRNRLDTLSISSPMFEDIFRLLEARVCPSE